MFVPCVIKFIYRECKNLHEEGDRHVQCLAVASQAGKVCVASIDCKNSCIVFMLCHGYMPMPIMSDSLKLGSARIFQVE